MNLKLLKYNLTLALALSGIHYYHNPESIKEYSQKLKSAGTEIVHKIETPIKAAQKLLSIRKPASKPETQTLSESSNPSDLPSESKSSHLPDDLNPELQKALKKNKKDFTENKDLDEIPKITETGNDFKEVEQLPSIKKEDESKNEKAVSGSFGGGFSATPTQPNVSLPGSGSSNSSSRSTGSTTPNVTTPTPTPTPCSPPNSPVGLSLMIINNKSELSWTAVSGVNSYTVYRGTTSGNLSLLESNISGTNFTDDFMTGGITYFYQVSSTDSCAESLTNSNEVSGQSLGSFIITSAVASEDQVILSWSNSSGSSSYTLLYGTSPGVYSSSISGSSPQTLSLPGGQTYYFKTTATNSIISIDTPELSVYIPTAFTDNFNFNSSSFYNLGDGSEIISGTAQLTVSNLVSEKTLNGTGSNDNQTTIDSNLSLQNDLVVMNSGSSGTYISKALDGKNSQVSLNALAFKTSMPFGKEIALSAESNYLLPVYNFSDSLIALWRFNESTFNNSPGEIHDAKGVIDGSTVGTITSTPGRLDKALSFNGGANYVVIPDNNSLENLSHMTISTWVYPTLLDGQPRAILSKRETNALNNAYSLFFYSNNKLAVDIVGTNNRFFSNKTFVVNNWYHIVVVFDGTQLSNSRVKLYVNGELDTTESEASNLIPSVNSNLFFGTLNANYGVYYQGKIDESAIWSKSLSLTQIQELYRRGANRVKFQMRTCDAISGNDCAGNITGWVGPDGTFNSYFSELDNNSSPVTKMGTVGLTPFNSTLDKFTAGLNTWLSIGNDANNRYIQYKAVLESDTGLFYPDFSKVSFSPINRYSVSASVSSLSSASVNFKS